MDFESPDVAKDFPGLYASGSKKGSDSEEEKVTRLDILGKKKESKKDKGYKVFEGESSDDPDEARSPGKSKKKSFKFPGKDRKEKNKSKDKKEEKEKVCKKNSKKDGKDNKSEIRDTEKMKKKKEINLIKIKNKKKKSSAQEVKEEKPIFGIPLRAAVEKTKSHDGIDLPIIVRECIDYIEEHGLACEGIYRMSGLKSKMRQLKDQYNKGEKVYLYEHEPHVVASLLKQYLRDLPEPILTSELTPKFEEAAALKNAAKRVESLQNLLNELPNNNRTLLCWILVHMLHVVSMEKTNKMNLQNVYIVLSPCLQISHNILHALFAHSDILVSGVEIKKYVPPIDLDSNRLSLELPDSPSAIANELSKQENALNILHAELNAGLRDHQKEEQLWEIQRVVTQLKRKLRFLRQVQATNHPQLSGDFANEKNSSHGSSSQVNTENKVYHSIQPSREISLNVENLAENSKQEVFSENSKQEVFTENSNQEVSTEKSQSLETTLNPNEDRISKEISSCQTQNSDDPSVASSVENVLTLSSTDIINDKDKENDSIVKNVSAIKTISHQVNSSEEIEKCASDDISSDQTLNDENYLQSLILEEKMLRLKSDELVLVGDELRKKINSEKLDMSRIRLEIQEYERFYKFKNYAYHSADNSSMESDDSSSSGDNAEEDLPEILKDLILENREMKEKNNEILNKIQHERELILNAKVQMKLIMQSRIFNTNTQEEHLI